MSLLIDLPTHKNERGCLTVIEKVLPFDIKRVYYIYNASGVRGGHRHKKAIQALICVHGECSVYSNNGEKKECFLLDSPSKCLILQPEDYHTMQDFSSDAVLLVLASDFYDENDYIWENYE